MKRVIKRISIVIAVAALAMMVWANRSGRFVPKPFNYGGELIPVTESTPWNSAVIPVRLGIFADNMYALDLSTQSVAVEGSVWITWPEAFQKVLDSEGLTVDQVVYPVNRVNSWDSIMRPLYAKPIRTPSGEYHQVIKFASRFYVDDLDLHRYPFEKVDFPIVFSLSTLSDAFGVDKVRLIPDASQSGVGPYVDVLGFVC